MVYCLVVLFQSHLTLTLCLPSSVQFSYTQIISRFSLSLSEPEVSRIIPSQVVIVGAVPLLSTHISLRSRMRTANPDVVEAIDFGC